MIADNDNDQELIEAYKEGRIHRRWSEYTLIGALIILAGICAGLALLNQRPAVFPRTIIQTGDTKGSAPVVVPLTSTFTVSPTIFLVVKAEQNALNDLFYCTKTVTTTCANLTRTPAVNEYGPVLNTKGTHVAYYGLENDKVELYLLTLPVDIKTLTLAADTSGLHINYEISPTLPPQFSLDNQWIAFLGASKKTSITELFTASQDGQRVLRVTNLKQRIVDFNWLSDNTIIFAVGYADGSQEFFSAVYDPGTYQFDVKPLDVTGLP